MSTQTELEIVSPGAFASLQDGGRHGFRRIGVPWAGVLDRRIDAGTQDEVGQLQDKLADAKARQKAMLMRQKTVSSRLDVKRTLDSNRLNDAMYKFERYEQKIDSLEAQVESYDLGKKTLRDEFAELAAQDQIDNELAALKAKLNNDNNA